MPPELAQLPIEITHFGSGIWSYRTLIRSPIFLVTVPATIITSAWRGVARKTPAPRRSRSNRAAPVAIISIAQQARPKVIGQSEFARAQFSSRSMPQRMVLVGPKLCRSFSILYPLENALPPRVGQTEDEDPQ